MQKEPNRRLIGVFIVSGILALTAIVSIYLREKVFMHDGKMLVMYFEESINGLNVGAPVVFKGVQVGKIAEIDLIANTEKMEFSIPVYAKMDARKNINAENFDNKMDLLDALIDRGLRARLTTQSYLTGLLMVELEMLPDTKVVLHGNPDRDAMEIPTVLSPMGEISKGIQDLPLRQSVESFNQFFDGLNKQMPQINEIVANLNKTVKRNSGMTGETLDNLNRTLINVGEAAKSMRNLTDYLERHPEAVLKGKSGGY